MKHLIIGGITAIALTFVAVGNVHMGGVSAVTCDPHTCWTPAPQPPITATPLNCDPHVNCPTSTPPAVTQTPITCDPHTGCVTPSAAVNR